MTTFSPPTDVVALMQQIEDLKDQALIATIAHAQTAIIAMETIVPDQCVTYFSGFYGAYFKFTPGFQYFNASKDTTARFEQIRASDEDDYAHVGDARVTAIHALARPIFALDGLMEDEGVGQIGGADRDGSL